MRTLSPERVHDAFIPYYAGLHDTLFVAFVFFDNSSADCSL